MTEEKFLKEVSDLRGDGIHFVLGYVARHIPAWIRYDAITAAKENGYEK
jgi:hypothetical protein